MIYCLYKLIKEYGMPNINRSEFDKNVIVTWDWECPSCRTYQTEDCANFETDDSVSCECCCESFSIIGG